MKRLIFRTAIITLGVALILAVSVFGIVSFVAPHAMMRFFDSLGMETISGDYAYQQYQISGDIDYLARSFELAAANDKDSVADGRFDELYGEVDSERRAAFYEYCTAQNKSVGDDLPAEVRGFDYRLVVCSKAAIVKYRLAETEEQKEALCDFVIEETGYDFTTDCPAVALSAEAASRKDRAFCTLLRFRLMSENKFNTQNTHYINIMKILEDATHE